MTLDDRLWREVQEREAAARAYRPKHEWDERRRANDLAPVQMLGERLQANTSGGVPTGRHRRTWRRVLRRHA